MASLYLMRGISIHLLLTLYLSTPTFAHAEIILNKLTACDGISSLYNSMKAGQLVSTRTCRLPKTSLEKELLARSGIESSQLCFDQSPPAPFLNGFSCVWQKWAQDPGLVCFRQADAVDIRLYKEQFGQKFAIPVAEYISKARTCAASNGDASTAVETLFPPLLTFISRFEIGFTSQLGVKKMSSDSIIVHGYAAVDPSIPDSPPSAIEFVSIHTNSPKYLPTSVKKSIGHWVVNIDSNEKLNKEYNRAARIHKIATRIDSLSFDIEKPTNKITSIDKKVAFNEELQQTVVNTLEDEGFETISDVELQANGGKSTDEIIEEIKNRMPFGTRDKSSITLGTVKILLNESRPACTNSSKGENATAAYILAFKPVPEVASDFGEISIIILGMGECSRKSSLATRTYFKELIEEISNQLFATLQSK